MTLFGTVYEVGRPAGPTDGGTKERSSGTSKPSTDTEVTVGDMTRDGEEG